MSHAQQMKILCRLKYVFSPQNWGTISFHPLTKKFLFNLLISGNANFSIWGEGVLVTLKMWQMVTYSAFSHGFN